MASYPARAVTNESGRTISSGDYSQLKGESAGKTAAVKAQVYLKENGKLKMLFQLVDQPRTDMIARFCISEGHDPMSDCILSENIKISSDGKRIRGKILSLAFANIEYRFTDSKIWTFDKKGLGL